MSDTAQPVLCDTTAVGEQAKTSCQETNVSSKAARHVLLTIHICLHIACLCLQIGQHGLPGTCLGLLTAEQPHMQLLLLDK